VAVARERGRWSSVTISAAAQRFAHSCVDPDFPARLLVKSKSRSPSSVIASEVKRSQADGRSGEKRRLSGAAAAHSDLHPSFMQSREMAWKSGKEKAGLNRRRRREPPVQFAAVQLKPRILEHGN
jgi:hypothetical protein